MSTRGAIFAVLGALGLDARRVRGLRHPTGRLIKLVGACDVASVIDVGANTGQFATELRSAGYRGQLISVEPLASAFIELSRRAGRDRSWTAIHAAAGATRGTAEINLAANSVSSSVLPMLPRHLDAAPESQYVGREVVEMRTVDDIAAQTLGPSARVLLKIDAQGYEAEVLRGAASVLERCSLIQLELSLVPLYAGSPTYLELIERLDNLGYDLVGLEAGFPDPSTGRLLQFDGVFARREVDRGV